MSSILFVSLMNSDPWGGSEVQWFAAANYALDKGDSVTCLVYDWYDKKAKMEKLVQNGATIIYIPNYGRAKKNLYQKLYFEWITRIQQRIFISSFNFSDYDFVVVNQGGFMEVANSPWKNIYKKLNSYVLTFHNYTLDFTFKPTKALVLKEWMLHSKYLICDAARIIKVLETQLNHQFTNIFPLVNPLTIPQSTTYTPYPLLQNNSYKIIMLAQLDVARKAQDNLIKAFANDNWKERNCIVEIYGAGEHYNLLKQLINQLQLNNKVFLKGNTNNVSAALEQAHLILQITHKDAMPISVIEAMSKSRAVVVSNVGDMPLWIKNFETGWVAKDASVEAIQETLEIAWQHREQWERLGKNAFDFFVKNFPHSVEDIFYNALTKPK